MNANRLFFLVIAPFLWSACSLLHFEHPGDEYGLWAFSSIAGSWIALLLPNIGDIKRSLIQYYVAGAGACVFAATGWLLIQLRASARNWGIIWACLAILIPTCFIARFDSLAQAVAKNGSITAYILAGFLAAATLTTVLMIIGTSLWQIFGGGARSKTPKTE